MRTTSLLIERREPEQRREDDRGGARPSGDGAESAARSQGLLRKSRNQEGDVSIEASFSILLGFVQTGSVAIPHQWAHAGDFGRRPPATEALFDEKRGALMQSPPEIRLEFFRVPESAVTLVGHLLFALLRQL